MLLSVKQLHYSRSNHELFRGLSFELPSQTVLQITGPNGAGKTTLLRLLAGFLAPIKAPMIELKAKCAYVGHHPAVNAHLTCAEYLFFVAQLHRATLLSVSELLAQFNLAQAENKLASKLSAGQKRRLALAGLTLMQAPLWLLDEPFTALDKEAVNLLQQLIATHIEQKGSVILTTHQTIEWEKHLPIEYLALDKPT